MLIKCPFCHAEARIPSSKEGAKVRCGACEKVYTARDPQARRTTSTTGLSLGIFVGAAVVAAIVFWLLNRTKGDPLPVPVADREQVEPERPPIDHGGWNSAPVQAVRRLYEAAAAGDARALDAALTELPADERAARAARVSSPSESGAPAQDLLADWKPYDGEVLSETDLGAVVRVRVGGRAPETAAETRQLDFRLVRSSGTEPDGQPTWRVEGWDRYLTPDEVQTAQNNAPGPEVAVERVELSDGSVVAEAEPGPIPHLATTSEELRRELEATYARMVDFGLRPKENAAAMAELVEAGKPALPVLLTGLYELPLETDDDAMKVNLVNQALEDITGHRTGFNPRLDLESTLGTTAERRESALRQWFAWWHQRGAAFEGRELGEDPLEALIEPTRRDLRQMERDRESNPGGSR